MIRIDFEYKTYNCPITQKYIAYFDLLETYNISYKDNIIIIKRDEEIQKTKASSYLEHFTIVDTASGIIKKRGTLNTERINQIDVSTLPTGIYVIQIFNRNIKKSYKVLIQKHY